MMNKQGVPNKVQHSIAGCKRIQEKIYIPLEQAAAFCNRFSMLTGKELAKVFVDANTSAKASKLPNLALLLPLPTTWLQRLLLHLLQKVNAHGSKE